MWRKMVYRHHRIKITVSGLYSVPFKKLIHFSLAMADAQTADNAVQQQPTTATTDDPVATTSRDNVSGDHTPHPKTHCACDEHYTKTVLETAFPCTLQTLYSILYEGSFMKTFLQDQKNTGMYRMRNDPMMATNI